jgi:hypothetical protein
MYRLAFAAAALFALAGTAPLAVAAQDQSAQPTSSNTPSAQRATDALNLLEAKGYGNFKDFRADGSNFDAAVKEFGHQFTVTIDPDSGQVTQQS